MTVLLTTTFWLSSILRRRIVWLSLPNIKRDFRCLPSKAFLINDGCDVRIYVWAISLHLFAFLGFVHCWSILHVWVHLFQTVNWVPFHVCDRSEVILLRLMPCCSGAPFHGQCYHWVVFVIYIWQYWSRSNLTLVLFLHHVCDERVLVSCHSTCAIDIHGRCRANRLQNHDTVENLRASWLSVVISKSK